MRTLKLTIAYDGTRYAGWQVQPNGTTIQSKLEEVFKKITGQQTRMTASGRTDAGVHALQQVVECKTNSHLSDEVVLRALNAELPNDIAIHKIETVGNQFHAIRDAKSKRYRYVIHDGSVPDIFQYNYLWHCYKNLDDQAMHQAAQLLRGEHDFISFQSQGAETQTTVRTIYDISVQRGKPCADAGQGRGGGGNLVTLEVEADGFLYNMVRTIVGTLYEVGRHQKKITWVEEVLAAKDRKAAGQTAPPQGLFLVYVKY